MDFLKNNRRFSFKLGGSDAFDSEYTTEVSERGNELITVYTFKNGLKVTNIAKKYDNPLAYEWVNYFENTSDEQSEVISELWDGDCTLPIEYEDYRKWVAYFPDCETSTKIYAPTGSNWCRDEFYCDVNKLVNNSYVNIVFPGEEKHYSASNGRSSEQNAPFFNIHKNGKGYIFAIGWSGQWNCEIKRTNDSITFKSKIEDTNFRLMPHEKFRTSSVVFMPYTGDFVTSQNIWRKLVKENFSLIGSDGRDKYAPLCAGIWGGMTTDSVMERIEKIKKHSLPFEYIWMDAGWYGENTQATPDEFEGDWWAHTGDWRVSRNIHPQELTDVSKAVHAAGMKFLLWFEPERVRKSTPIDKEHIEYLLFAENPDEENRLLNLGNDEAWEYCRKTLAGLIEKLNIDCLRIDYNFNPLEYWRNNDTADRKGISEIKYINGLYKLWDCLLEQFPHMIIDDCASGGRRIDIETLRRSVPLWRSDLHCPANYNIEYVQCHHQNYNTWMPYSGTGTGRPYDEYRIRSAYAAGLTAEYSFSASEPFADSAEKVDFIKKYTAEYLKVRPYFSEDFYPLTESTSNSDVWFANQFDRPSENDGIVQIFVRERTPYDTAIFKLHNVREDKTYVFTDADGGEFTVSGKTLIADGFKVTIPEKRKAKIYFYKAQ